MDDTKLLDWVERVHAQIWHDKKDGNWVCQVIWNHTVVQPARPTLRHAITEAKRKVATLQPIEPKRIP